MHCKKIENRTAQRLLLSSVTSLSVLSLGAGVTKAAIISTLYNTGETNAGGLVAQGTVDPHYTLTVNPQGGSGPYVTNSTSWQIAGGNWGANTSNSQWISPQTYYSNTVSVTSDAVGNYTYQTTFSLAGLNPATASITGQYYVDNAVVQLDLNGVNTGYVGLTPGHGNINTLESFTINSGFIAGNNTLSFVVEHTSASGSNPSGIEVENMVGTATAVPEPASLGLMGLAVAGLASRRRSTR